MKYSGDGVLVPYNSAVACGFCSHVITVRMARTRKNEKPPPPPQQQQKTATPHSPKNKNKNKNNSNNNKKQTNNNKQTRKTSNNNNNNNKTLNILTTASLTVVYNQVRTRAWQTCKSERNQRSLLCKLCRKSDFSKTLIRILR